MSQTKSDLIVEILEKNKVPISKPEIMAQAAKMGIPFVSENALHGALYKETIKENSRIEVIKTSPLTYRKVMGEKVSQGILVDDVVDVLENIDVKKLKLQNEHELELVVFGALQGNFGDAVKYRESIGGRMCDLGMKDIAIEMKYIKSQSDKDRIAGQIMDYLKGVPNVIVVAMDEKRLLKDSPIGKIKGVNVIIV